MPNLNLKNTLAEFLQGSRTLIENAIGLPEIAEALAGYGYDEAGLREGLRLWSEADSLAKKQAKDYGEQYEATQELEKARAAANAVYMKTLKVARVAFGDNAKAIAALKLYGPRKQSVAGWVEQATLLYSNLASDAKLAEALGRFGYGQEKLKAEAALVEEVRRKTQTQAQGSGAAHSATAARDKKLRELDTWVSELRTICRVAFYESPQELEKLGKMALNSHRRAKKAEPAPTEAKASG
jgi:hypothetical protein